MLFGQSTESIQSVTTTLSILRSPTTKSQQLTPGMMSSPSGRSPLSAFSVGMARGPAVQKAVDPPRTPNKWLTEDQVFKALAMGADGPEESALEPCADEILLPFRDRKVEIKGSLPSVIFEMYSRSARSSISQPRPLQTFEE